MARKFTVQHSCNQMSIEIFNLGLPCTIAQGAFKGICKKSLFQDTSPTCTYIANVKKIVLCETTRSQV